VLVDRVNYADLPPWPIAADGTGLSLHRIDVAAYGNEPMNWTAAAPTPAQPQTLDLFRLEFVDHTPTLTTLQFTALADRTYRVFFRNSLGDGDWLLLETVPARATNRIVTITDPAQDSTRFYRATTP
jgi:hypothetical protein